MSAGLNSSSPGSPPSSPRLCCSGGESCHLQGDALPQLFGLLASLQVLQHIIELHHTHRRQAESAAGTADDVDKVIIVRRCQVDESVVDILRRQRGRCDSTSYLDRCRHESFSANQMYGSTSSYRSNCTGVCPSILHYECRWGDNVGGAERYLQVGLLAALDKLVERWRSEVGVDVGRVQPLQSLHDDLLQDERAEDTFCCSDTELVHVVDSWQSERRRRKKRRVEYVAGENKRKQFQQKSVNSDWGSVNVKSRDHVTDLALKIPLFGHGE